MLRKLLRWLIRAVFGSRYEYYELGDGKYLKVERGAAEIIRLTEVPVEARRDQAAVEPQLLAALEAGSGPALGAATRLSILKRLPPVAILEQALKNTLIKQDVLDKPDLVDADSALEAQLKLDLLAGKDIADRIDATPDLTEADIEDMLDTEFLLKWGYNTFGDDLADTLNTGEPPADSESDGRPAATARGDTGTERASKAGPTSRGRDRIPKAPTAADTGTSASAGTNAATGNSAAAGNSAAGSTSADTSPDQTRKPGGGDA